MSLTKTPSDMLSYLPSGTGAVSTTVKKKLGEIVSVKDFGAVGDGVVDDTVAIQKAIDAANGLVHLHTGTMKITSQLVVRNGCTGLVGSGMYQTVLNKTFNGDAISSLTNGAVLSDFDIDGNGATYTGGGIMPKGYNTVIERVRVFGTADSPILVNGAAGSNTLAATYLSVKDCFLMPYNSTTTYAVRSIGVDDATAPTCRRFTNLNGGSSLIDFSGMNYVTLEDSLGTSVKFSSTSGKVHISGCRLTCTDNIVIYGVDHIIEGNLWGFPSGKSLSIDTSAANVHFAPSNSISINGVYAQPIGNGTTIGTANTHALTTNLTSYPFVWNGTTSNYSPGNGTFSAYYRQDARLCTASFSAIVNTTTTVAVGTWTFQLPFKAHVTAIGQALVKSSSGTYYPAVVEVQGGSSIAVIYLNGGTHALASGDIAFSTNSLIEASITYMLAPS